LSGSANVIRILKDRFNAEGDVNLVQSNEYYDPHAIAGKLSSVEVTIDETDELSSTGLLKQYLRELPVHLLTRELHTEFLRVIGEFTSLSVSMGLYTDFRLSTVDLRARKDRVNALGKLVARLPIEEYTLFRFLSAPSIFRTY